MMDAREFFSANRRTIVISVVLFSLALGLHLLRNQMSKLDEDVVYDHYQKSIDATRGFDARTLCGMMDKDYRSIDVARTPRAEERTQMDRTQACTAMRESMAMMKDVVAATRLEPDFKYVIESVTLSPDRKQAVVKMRASMQIGKRVSVTSAGTETLVRRMGRVFSKGSDTRSTVSVR
jgi:hypothetical protein